MTENNNKLSAKDRIAKAIKKKALIAGIALASVSTGYAQNNSPAQDANKQRSETNDFRNQNDLRDVLDQYFDNVYRCVNRASKHLEPSYQFINFASDWRADITGKDFIAYNILEGVTAENGVLTLKNGDTIKKHQNGNGLTIHNKDGELLIDTQQHITSDIAKETYHKISVIPDRDGSLVLQYRDLALNLAENKELPQDQKKLLREIKKKKEKTSDAFFQKLYVEQNAYLKHDDLREVLTDYFELACDIINNPTKHKVMTGMYQDDNGKFVEYNMLEGISVEDGKIKFPSGETIQKNEYGNKDIVMLDASGNIISTTGDDEIIISGFQSYDDRTNSKALIEVLRNIESTTEKGFNTSKHYNLAHQILKHEDLTKENAKILKDIKRNNNKETSMPFLSKIKHKNK